MHFLGKRLAKTVPVRLALALGLALLWGQGCGLSGCSYSSSSAQTTEQLNGGCSTTPATLTGLVPAGGACTKAEECAPQCCPCASDGRAWLAALCDQHVCVTGADLCAKTKGSNTCK